MQKQQRSARHKRNCTANRKKRNTRRRRRRTSTDIPTTAHAAWLTVSTPYHAQSTVSIPPPLSPHTPPPLLPLFPAHSLSHPLTNSLQISLFSVLSTPSTNFFSLSSSCVFSVHPSPTQNKKHSTKHQNEKLTLSRKLSLFSSAHLRPSYFFPPSTPAHAKQKITETYHHRKTHT